LESNKPFLAVMLTLTAHKGGDIHEADGFKATANNPQARLYQYSDWALKRFIGGASKQKWFSNTVFAFIADHGQNFDAAYDMPLSYHHSPFIIYAPSFLKPSKSDKLGLQLDVFPTIMGVLKLPYVNNTLGIDLLKENRQFAFFSADDKLGIINHDYFLIIRNDGSESLFNYKNRDLKNYIYDRKSLVDSMKTYTFSMLQSVSWLIENRKTGLPYY
jgi:phosphoglycerol transferase MdoB-like AlkP superfamily enzyme